MSTEPDKDYKQIIMIEDYKGFAIRKAKKGYLAFKGSRSLPTCDTVEEAVASVDQHIEWERQRVEWNRREQEAREQREQEEAERERIKTEAVSACIQAVRDFVRTHGMGLLHDCVNQLDREEDERNVPANWEELVKICEAIAAWRYGEAEDSEPWENHLDEEPGVSKYGVIEEITYTRDDHPTYTREYTLEEYIDDNLEYYKEYLEENEEEDPEIRRILGLEGGTSTADP